MTRRLLSYAFPFMDSLDPLAPATDSSALDDTLQMDEETFRGFYTRTSGMLWAYLARATNDPSAADDLLQEAYYRLLRATTTFESDDHRQELPVPHRHEPDSRSLPAAAHRQRAAAGAWRRRHSGVRRSRAADAAAIGSAPRDGAAQPARARAGVARVRAGIDASGNRRRARIEDGQHQAAAVSRAPEACEDSGIMRLRDCQCDKPECPECGPLVALARADPPASSSTRSSDARVPTPEIVWWRAQMRAREEAARTAARPILFTQALAIAALIGLLVSVAGRLTLPAHVVVATCRRRSVESAALAHRSSPPLCWLVIAPVAVYFALVAGVITRPTKVRTRLHVDCRIIRLTLALTLTLTRKAVD